MTARRGIPTADNTHEVAEFTRFFDGLEVVAPGVTSVAAWRAEDAPQPRPSAAEVSMYGAVARKP